MQQTFGTVLRAHLHALAVDGRKLTYEDLAEKCGCSVGTIKNYLADKNKGGPNPAVVDTLARLIGERMGWSADDPRRTHFVAMGTAPWTAIPSDVKAVPRAHPPELPKSGQTPEIAPPAPAGLPARASRRLLSRERFPLATGFFAIALVLLLVAGNVARGVIAGPSDASTLPPLPKPSWSGYTVERGSATCQKPGCLGYTASIVVDFQWSTTAHQVWLAGKVLACSVQPGTLVMQLFSCNNYRVDHAHEYVGMTYAVDVPDPRTHKPVHTLGWLRLDFFADGHTTQMSGPGIKLGGPLGA